MNEQAPSNYDSNIEQSGERQGAYAEWTEAMKDVPPFDDRSARERYNEAKRMADTAENEKNVDVLTRDEKAAREADLEFVKKCPTGGINLTSDELPSAQVLKLVNADPDTQRRALAASKNAGLAERAASLTDEELARLASGVYQGELAKYGAVQRDIMPLIKDGKACRIHPYGPASAFSTEFYSPEKGFEPNSMNLVQEIVDVRKQLEAERGPLSSDFTTVMNYSKLDLPEGMQYPSEGEPLSKYIEMCRAFVKESGAENGHGLVLELGNETNVSSETRWGDAKPFERNAEDFSKECDPREYAKMYFATASELKAECPELQISLAGTAFYDPEWISTVCEEVSRLQKENGVDTPLIDVISFHDYREDDKSPMPQVYHDGRDVHIGNSEAGSYEEQIASMEQLAEKYGARLDCGECGYGSRNSQGEFSANLDALSRMADKAGGITTKTWNSAVRVRTGQ